MSIPCALAITKAPGAQKWKLLGNDTTAGICVSEVVAKPIAQSKFVNAQRRTTFKEGVIVISVPPHLKALAGIASAVHRNRKPKEKKNEVG